MAFDHVLAVGFGAPRKLEEVTTFLQVVAQGTTIPAERLEEVRGHYERIGGGSPYAACAERFCEALRAALPARGCRVPIFLGMRNWHPFLRDTIRDIAARGLRRGLAVVLAPHRSPASYDRYVASVEDEAKTASPLLRYGYLDTWHEHPGFVAAWAARAREALDALAPEERAFTHVLFTAHSIPLEMERRSHYEEAVWESSDLTARELGLEDWGVAFQSRSGSPQEPWLGPDPAAAARTIHANGARRVLLVPVGFLFENAELLYDLDVELRAACDMMGLGYLRAPAVSDHPALVEMFADLLAAELAAAPPRERM